MNLKMSIIRLLYGFVLTSNEKNVLLSSPDVETDEISNAPDVFCGLGLVLGLLGVPAGIFFFVKGNQYQNIREA